MIPFGYYSLLLVTIWYYWVLLITFGFFFVLFVTFGFYCVFFGTIGYFWVPLGYYWGLLGTKEYFLGQPSLSWQLSLAQLSPNLLIYIDEQVSRKFLVLSETSSADPMRSLNLCLNKGLT